MRFNVSQHSVRPGVQVVEVFDSKGRLVATVTEAEDGRSIKVVSKYATGDVVKDDGRGPNVAHDGRKVLAFVILLKDPDA